MKKFKSYAILTILFTTIISIIISPTIAPFVYAEDGAYSADWGNHDTAQKKEWFSMLFDCTTIQNLSWNTTMTLNGGRITSKTVNGDNWFRPWTSFPSASFTDYRSPLVEVEVTGDYDDGGIFCGDNSSALVKKALNALEVSKEDIVCDYSSNNYEAPGALTPEVSSANCDSYFKANNDEIRFLKSSETDAKMYLTKLVIARNTSNANIGLNDMFSLTDLETYFVKYDAFTNACTTGGAEFGKTGRTYTIQEINPSTNEVETAGYSGKTSPSENDYVTWFLQSSETCQQLANDLNSDPLVSSLKKYAEYLRNNNLTLDEDNENEGDNTDNDAATDNCQNSGGAGSLGWIVCPILDWMQEATDGLYTSIVEPSLQVRSSFFNTSDGSGQNTYEAWGVFRDIANVIFAILVLFVIFSQLTGVGIDNYGIKKILPKLIVAAVLINLSYLICVLCVDLSNIIGSGIKDFLDTLGNRINEASNAGTIAGVDVSKVNAASFGILAVGVVSVAVGVYAVYSNSALLLTLFVSVLGVFISILFVFILLAGRQAAIILLTVVSPVAFILYMLPNTKKIFDKWLNLWKAMLLLYPICGLLIGGGNFASSLMLSISDGGIVIVFTAMIVGIIPIFFIPSLLRSAFAAMGNIGGAISGFSSRLRGGANRALTGNPLYKNLQARGQERQERLGNIRQERRKYRGAARRAGVYVDENGDIQQSNRVSARARRWLADKGFSGVAAEMGRNTAELARMEAARRGNLANADFSAAQATFAGINEKEATQRIADQEALMTSGRASFNGSILNVNNGKQLKGYHAQMLQTANDAKASGDTAAYNAAMDKVKAAQNLLSKTNTGRQSVQENLEAAAKSGASGGLNEAAGHLLNAHGPDYKAANRGMHKLIQDLATTDLGAKDNNGVTGIDRIKQGINDHSYDKAGIDKYTAQTLASADDAALDRLAKSALTGSMTDTEAETLFSTIQKASNNPNIHLQPEIKQKFDNIVYGLQQGQNIGSDGKVRR